MLGSATNTAAPMPPGVGGVPLAAVPLPCTLLRLGGGGGGGGGERDGRGECAPPPRRCS